MTDVSLAKSTMEASQRRRGGHLVAEALSNLGVDIAFTLSGGFINPILEGLTLHNIRIVNAPHEQTAGHLADGMARISREPAVCIAGPEGFANAVPAMLEAYGQRSPVVFITGSSTLKRRGQGGFKEVDHVKIAEPLTKYSALVTHGELIPDFIYKAFQIAIDGQPGPVHVSIPTDLLYSSYEVRDPLHARPFETTRKTAHLSHPSEEDMEMVDGLLNAAERPVFVAGSGVWYGHADQELIRLSEAYEIPTYLVPYHQTSFAGGSETYQGLADIHQFPPSEHALENADLVVAIGCRLDNALNFGNPPLISPAAKLVCINGSLEELADNHAADICILGSPKPVLANLLEKINGRNDIQKTGWFAENAVKRSTWVNSIDELLQSQSKQPPFHPLQISTALFNALGENDFLIVDGGDTHYWAEIALNIAELRGRKLRGVFHPGPFSLLGCGVSFGVALKLRYPESNVVLLSGDGAFLAGGLSIESSFCEAAPITVVIDNNMGLGSIAQQQKAIWDSGTSAGTAFRDIPFDGLFSGLGGHGETIDDLKALPDAIRDAADRTVPTGLNIRSKSIISPLVSALTDRRAKSSIE